MDSFTTSVNVTFNVATALASSQGSPRALITESKRSAEDGDGSGTVPKESVDAIPLLLVLRQKGRSTDKTKGPKVKCFEEAPRRSRLEQSFGGFGSTIETPQFFRSKQLVRRRYLTIAPRDDTSGAQPSQNSFSRGSDGSRPEVGDAEVPPVSQSTAI
ncbi:MAG: hypothetical protein M1837_005263 [Sclerophora amabilis]|nr:MAG: hypothetical protein M1837_005263 [Sclerophora amabilis]